MSASVYRANRQAYRDGTARTDFNETDGIFEEALLLDLSEEGSGYLGTISFDVAES